MLTSPLSFLGLKSMNLKDFDDFRTPQGPPLGSLSGPFWIYSGSSLALFREVSVKKKVARNILQNGFSRKTATVSAAAAAAAAAVAAATAVAAAAVAAATVAAAAAAGVRAVAASSSRQQAAGSRHQAPGSRQQQQRQQQQQ